MQKIRFGYWYVFLFFVISGLLIYQNSLSSPFFYDDEMYVVNNLNIRTLDNIFLFFKKASTLTAKNYPGGHYRPLVVTSYAVNYAIGGLNPFGYHLVNLGFHIGSAFLIFLIVKAIYPPFQKGGWGDLGFFAAIAAGLIFLVHPFNTETVNYITARSSVMSGFFYLLAFYFWVKYRMAYVALGFIPNREDGHKGRRYGFYLFSLLAFIAGMLSKEVVITLPIVLWLYDLYFTKDDIPHSALRTPDFLKWRTYISYLPFVLVVAGPYVLMRIFFVGRMLPGFQRDAGTQMFTQIPVLVKHWQMFLFPYPLTLLHDIPIRNSFWSYDVIVPFIILIIYITTAVILLFLSFRVSRLISFFMFWFFIALIPTTIFPLNFIFQENRGYMAIVSFVSISGLLLGEVRRIGYKKPFAVLLALIVLIYSVAVFQRNKTWKNELTLWSDAVQKAPKSSVAWTALAVAYRRADMYNQSMEASKKAINIGGWRNFVVHDNLARIYMKQERWDLSAMEFEKAIKITPVLSVIHNDLGIAYYKLGKYDLAEAKYREAIRLDPADYRPYFNLGVLYGNKGMSEEAVNAYQKALSVFPGHLRSRLHIGIELEELGRKKESVNYYRYVVLHAVNDDERILAAEAKRSLNEMGEKGVSIHE